MEAGDTSREPDRQELLDAWLALTGQVPAAGDVRLPVLSGSMLPALPPGAVLVITPGRRVPLRRGDVAVFEVEGRLVAHRVLGRLRLPGCDLIFEKGDGNPHGSWRRAELVRGVVREAILPDGRRLQPGDAAAAWRSFWHLLRSWRR